MKKNVVGGRVQHARTAQSISQKDLSNRLLSSQGISISEDGIQRLEQGQRKVSDIELLAIAAVLRVNPGWLLGQGTLKGLIWNTNSEDS